jgi:hypothetical protein
MSSRGTGSDGEALGNRLCMSPTSAANPKRRKKSRPFASLSPHPSVRDKFTATIPPFARHRPNAYSAAILFRGHTCE